MDYTEKRIIEKINYLFEKLKKSEKKLLLNVDLKLNESILMKDVYTDKDISYQPYKHYDLQEIKGPSLKDMD